MKMLSMSFAASLLGEHYNSQQNYYTDDVGMSIYVKQGNNYEEVMKLEFPILGAHFVSDVKEPDIVPEEPEIGENVTTSLLLKISIGCVTVAFISMLLIMIL